MTISGLLTCVVVGCVSAQPHRGLLRVESAEDRWATATRADINEDASQSLIRELEGEEAIIDEGVEEVRTLSSFTWRQHLHRTCQGYANGDSATRSLDESKVACIVNEACAAVSCSTGRTDDCTLRSVANLLEYSPEDCYEKMDPTVVPLHPAHAMLVQEYPFKPVLNQHGQPVNIILVQSPFENDHQRSLHDKHKDELLFLGISSFEDYPKWSNNPFSGEFEPKEYMDIFPGFLHMMRKPNEFFSNRTKTILMSQSDFMLPDFPARDYSIPKRYDFTLSGSDQDVASDCVGWSSYAKNWSFTKQALEVMCGEYNLTGVLVATKDKQGRKACTIPDSCKGKMLQTTFLTQEEYFDYLKQSRFAFLPQVHDASPRVSTQALSMDVPLLMNAHISGGWKYLNKKTGESFHDLSDFRQSLEKIIDKSDVHDWYEPRKYVLEHYGNLHSGKRLLKFVQDNFGDRVKLPPGTTMLVASSR